MKPGIFDIKSNKKFNSTALDIFRFQAEYNEVYREYLKALNINAKKFVAFEKIPFLPIGFLETHEVVSRSAKNKIIFKSSGTSSANASRHYVADISVYEESFHRCFELFYGDIKQFCILALLPSYLERKDSSLIYMADGLIRGTENSNSGFYLHNLDKLIAKIEFLEKKKQKTILLGVSYALLDLIEIKNFKLKNTIVMETGGMKGKRKEMIREELHKILCEGFGVQKIHSEYGMTELLSQAYSKGGGIFHCPSWMKVLIRDMNDPFRILEPGKTGGINVIDLANYNSCSFIATQDLGKIYEDGSFEVLGRFDNSDLRGCNLLVE